MNVLVLDFGGSAVKYALVNEKADMMTSGKAHAPLGSVEEFQETVYKLFDQFKDRAEGIAISLPGYIDADKGFLIGSGVYSALHGKNIVDIVKAVCAVPVTVENDGKCGALAEAWKGQLSEVNDGVTIILGSGIAGGIIKDRKIHGGKGCTAGELSYTCVDTTSAGFGCCATFHVGMMGITYKACRMKNLDFDFQDQAEAMHLLDSFLHNRYPEMKGEPKKIKADGKQLFKWIEEGDKDAELIYDEFIRGLGVMVYNTQIVYAPERIVIGGGLSNQPRVITDLKKELNRYYSVMGLPEFMQSEIVRSEYGDECNILGAMFNYILRVHPELI